MPVMVPATGVPVDVLVEGDSNGWLGADLVSTADGQAVALTASSNPHGRPRSGIVTVEGLSGERVSFSVTQWGWCESGGGDCDGDGISDACAIAQGAAVDLNDNGIPDRCEQGTVVTVPGDHATLSEAVSAATDGWVIRLQPGVHQGPIDLQGRRLSIVGLGSRGEVVIDGTVGSDPAIRIGGGLHAEPGSTILSNLVVLGSSDGSHRGGALLVSGGEATVEGCVFEGGLASMGGGIGIHEGGLVLVDSIVRGNVAVLGGGLHVEAGEALLISSSIVANLADTSGGGIFVESDASSCNLISTMVCGNAPEDAVGSVVHLDEPESCECRADLNGDGVVDGADLSALMAEWGASDSDVDLDFNGVVDGSDLARLVGAWGVCSD
jgi:hypothetical protein